MVTPTREQIYHIDDCAERPFAVWQWTTRDGEERGVHIRALTFKDRMLAERAATGKDGKIDAWRLVAEETRAGITRPAGLTVDTLLSWNAQVVIDIHTAILSLGGIASDLLAAELARLAGGVAREPEPIADNVGDGADAAPEPAPA
jgi:hypothetical protein